MRPEEQDLVLVRFCNLLQKFDNIHKMAESKEIQKFYKGYPEMLEMFNYEYGKKCRFLELGEICSKKEDSHSEEKHSLYFWSIDAENKGETILDEPAALAGDEGVW